MTIAVLAVALLVALVLLVLARSQVGRARRRTQQLEAELATERGRGPERPRTVVAAERALRTVVDTAVRVRQQGVGGLVMSSLDELSRWAMEDRSEIVRLAAADGSVTILFSDIEGSTAMNDELGDEDWVQLLIAHDTMVRAHVERRGGHIVKSQGDGFMVVFDTPARAVKAGLDVQRSFSEARSRLLRREPISVRVGIHCGPVVSRGDDFFGLNVAIAARVGAEARGGETLVTQEVADALGTDRRFVLGRVRVVELKGVPGSRTLHPVTRAGRPGRPAGSLVGRHG